MTENKKNAERRQAPVRPHTVTIDNRKRAQLTGVLRVISSANSRLSLETSLGGLVIEGADLTISRFSDTEGTLGFEGNISSLKYVKGPTSLVKKIFK